MGSLPHSLISLRREPKQTPSFGTSVLKIYPIPSNKLGFLDEHPFVLIFGPFPLRVYSVSCPFPHF